MKQQFFNAIREKFENISVVSKLKYSLFILFGLFLGVIFFYKTASQNVCDKKNELVVMSQMAQFIQEKETDHLRWVNKLSNAIIANTEFDGQLDPTQCAFGKWYYNYKPTTPELEAAWKDMEDAHTRLHEEGKTIMAAWRTGATPDQLILQYQQAVPRILTEVGTKLTAFKTEINKQTTTLQAETDAQYATYTYYIYVAFALMVVIGLFFTQLIVTTVIKPLNAIKDVVKRASAGDFDARVTIYRNDEFGQVIYSLNYLLDQFEVLMEEITTSNEYAAKGKYFRKPVSVGLKGYMNKTAELVKNSLTVQEKSTVSLEKERAYLKAGTEQLLEAMDRFAHGDLTVQLRSNNKDEMGQLFNGFSTAVEKVRQSILRIEEAVEATASASAEISSSVEEMAAGAREQSQQTSEIAVSIDEMVNTINDTTKNSGNATEYARKAGVTARDGGKVIAETIEGMNRISEVVQEAAKTVKVLGSSSDRIGEIVQVIHDIADQTNLLALNAAIEAARAGEQGRGFAVVADEVRKLAERTSKATKEIVDMINVIQKDTERAVNSMEEGTRIVEHGKTNADHARVVLTEILQASEQVVDVITQVASASEEQAASSRLISQNIDAINHVTRESTVGMQQVAQTAEDLNRLTENLYTLMSSFHFNKVRGNKKPAPSYN